MKRKSLIISAVLCLWLSVTAAMSFGVLIYRDDIHKGWDNAWNYIGDVKDGVFASVGNAGDITMAKIVEGGDAVVTAKDNTVQGVADAYDGTISYFERTTSMIGTTFTGAIESIGASISSFTHDLVGAPQEKKYSVAHERRRAGMINAAYDIGVPPPPLTLSEIKRRKQEGTLADYNAAMIEPAAGTPVWAPDQPSITAEAVLVPRQVTVISSSQDGRIADIFVNHGDNFKKGDLLIAYDCTDVAAEAEIAKMQKDLTTRKVQGTDKLFKLDIISDLDRLGAEVEDKQAAAKARAYSARMEDCQIRARFDGRVTNRLANPGEYTRTDRVLLEVASNEPLQAEFLVPSKWLRWVNTGAPVTLTIGETEKTYTARINTIHGEVDPVSQSIQMIATLDSYDDPLLPGMSGQVTINVDAIRNAGIKGYLEAGYTPAR